MSDIDVARLRFQGVAREDCAREVAVFIEGIHSLDRESIMNMKYSFLIIIVALLVNGCSSTDRLVFDDTVLCVPKNYLPGISLYTKILTLGMDLDSSENSRRISVPKELLLREPPTPAKNDLHRKKQFFHGIAYQVSNIHNPKRNEQEAWNIFNRHRYAESKVDESGRTRLYERRRSYEYFYLVESIPPIRPDDSAPEDWYIGWCSTSTDDCSQSIIYGSTYFKYKLDLSHIEQSKAVKNALIQLFEEWERNCE